MATDTLTQGGSWLIENTRAETVFTRERLNDEQRMIGQTAEEFARDYLEAVSPLIGRHATTGLG